MINIRAGIQHLKNLTAFYKKEDENENPNDIGEDLKTLNEKLLRLYDVVKNDPQYMKRNYKASANHIQNLMSNKTNNEYVPFNRIEEGEDSDQDVEDDFVSDKMR